MKLTDGIPIFAISLIASAISNGISPTPAVAAGTTQFICGRSRGSPATIAQTPRGSVPVILWQSQHFSGAGYTPQTRCQMVTARFQKHYQDGTLRYITTGMVNRQPVVCVALSEKGSCLSILFTLKPGTDPNQVLLQVLNVRDKGSTPLNESTSPIESTSAMRVSIDMEEFLKTTPVEATDSSTPNQSTTPEVSRPFAPW
jgi:hypothetical protein